MNEFKLINLQLFDMQKVINSVRKKRRKFFKNELIISETDNNYYIKNIKNDNIAIYGLLVGFIVGTVMAAAIYFSYAVFLS